MAWTPPATDTPANGTWTPPTTDIPEPTDEKSLLGKTWEAVKNIGTVGPRTVVEAGAGVLGSIGRFTEVNKGAEQAAYTQAKARGFGVPPAPAKPITPQMSEAEQIQSQYAGMTSPDPMSFTGPPSQASSEAHLKVAGGLSALGQKALGAEQGIKGWEQKQLTNIGTGEGTTGNAPAQFLTDIGSTMLKFSAAGPAAPLAILGDTYTNSTYDALQRGADFESANKYGAANTAAFAALMGIPGVSGGKTLMGALAKRAATGAVKGAALGATDIALRKSMLGIDTPQQEAVDSILKSAGTFAGFDLLEAHRDISEGGRARKLVKQYASPEEGFQDLHPKMTDSLMRIQQMEDAGMSKKEIMASPDVKAIKQLVKDGRALNYAVQNKIEFKGESKPQEAPNAIQEQGPGSILQHPQEGTGEEGGQRGGVEQGVQGQEAPQARSPEEGGEVPKEVDRRAEQTPVAEDHRQGERRQDVQTRKRVADMTSQEMQNELLTSDKTGLGNLRAYHEAEPKPIKASMDVDSLKWVNDTLGHETGDLLLSRMGDALKAAGLDKDAFHVSGDEFWAHGDDPEKLNGAFDKAYSYLKDNPITVEMPDGKKVSLVGGFSYGTGKSISEAEKGLQAHKSAREEAGQRAARGAEPPGVSRTESGLGVPDNQREENKQPQEIEDIRATQPIKVPPEELAKATSPVVKEPLTIAPEKAEEAREHVRRLFPGDENKDLRNQVYRSPETLKQIRDLIASGAPKADIESRVNIAAMDAQFELFLNKKGSQAGFLNIKDMADAFGDLKKKLFSKAEADKPMTREEFLDAFDKASPHVLDLGKVDMKKDVNQLLAYMYTRMKGGTVREGVPQIGEAFFPSEAPKIADRDLTKIESGLSKVFNPNSILSGGVATSKEPVYKLGQDPVAEAGFANLRKFELQRFLKSNFDAMLKPFSNSTKEVDAAIKPIFRRSRELSSKADAYEKQLGSILEMRGLERKKEQTEKYIEKLKHDQANDLPVPLGAGTEEQANTRKERMKARQDAITKGGFALDKYDRDIADALRRAPKGPEIERKENEYKAIQADLAKERENLDQATQKLGAKYARVRIAVAADLGADSKAYPDWLKKNMSPGEQEAATLVRKFMDEQAKPALEKAGVPVIQAKPALEKAGVPVISEGKSYLPQPTRRYFGKWENPRPVAKKNFREDVLNPDTIKFAHKEENAPLWVPDIGTILDSYVQNMPNILAKKELANRWDPAITEMRAKGQNRLADLSEKFLNGFVHGKERIPAIDALTNYFFFTNLALNPAPGLLHAVKNTLLSSQVGPSAAAKAYLDVGKMMGNSEEAKLAKEVTSLWRGGSGGRRSLEQESGLDPTSKAMRKAYGLSASVPTGYVEMVNRCHTLMGSLELAKAQGLSNDEAMQVAMGATLAVDFLGVDRAAMAQGSLGRAFFAFASAPQKISEFGLRKAMDTVRAARAMKSGKGYKGSIFAPAKGDAGQNYRRLHQAAIYATTFALIHEAGKLLNTKRLEEGILAIPRWVQAAASIAKGSAPFGKGAVVDVLPALTQFNDNIDKYGRLIGTAATVTPRIIDKAMIAAQGHGAPTRKTTKKMWGTSTAERATRYFMNAPKATEQEKVEKAVGKKTEHRQHAAAEKWLKEHGL